VRNQLRRKEIFFPKGRKGGQIWIPQKGGGNVSVRPAEGRATESSKEKESQEGEGKLVYPGTGSPEKAETIGP